ncbi:hypothetical protein BD626DRAFT_565644 [Schizophyllum amplum]|uniref:Uncharacterized protein n=1 Tax=Schizophyllum amplum TaxID=97359 RepID=A0A550CP71_9AGAR|nr:hypothetical protein BD626DRAFT_565644 [Auriculariopsis ampla]
MSPRSPSQLVPEGSRESDRRRRAGGAFAGAALFNNKDFQMGQALTWLSSTFTSIFLGLLRGALGWRYVEHRFGPSTSARSSSGHVSASLAIRRARRARRALCYHGDWPRRDHLGHTLHINFANTQLPSPVTPNTAGICVFMAPFICVFVRSFANLLAALRAPLLARPSRRAAFDADLIDAPYHAVPIVHQCTRSGDVYIEVTVAILSYRLLLRTAYVFITPPSRRCPIHDAPVARDRPPTLQVRPRCPFAGGLLVDALLGRRTRCGGGGRATEEEGMLGVPRSIASSRLSQPLIVAANASSAVKPSTTPSPLR